MAMAEHRLTLEEEIDTKVESTPWKTILNHFIKAYDYKKEPIDSQVANVTVPILSLSAAKASKQTLSIEPHNPPPTQPSTKKMQYIDPLCRKPPSLSKRI